MNKRVLAILGLVLLGGILFWGGVVFAQWQRPTPGWQTGWMMNPGSFRQPDQGMMGNWQGTGTAPAAVGSYMMDPSMMHGGIAGPGMMHGGAAGPGMMHGGMMGSYTGVTSADPLSIEEAEAAVNDYLATLGDESLFLGEIMIFDNHAYAQILDESTDQGAFEVLVDPLTGRVYPEPGPNMMWNNAYGMMGGNNGMGMMDGHMRGSFGYAAAEAAAITGQEAVTIAQDYLDQALPGRTADTHADAFPGYYTLHILEDGEVVGMLSVHANSGQVFVHHWHGTFIEMSATDHE